VKSWRIWFLLLLAVLLPVRGAVAAAMLCPVAGSGMQLELAMEGHSSGHEAMDHAMAHDHSGSHDHASSHEHGTEASHDGHAGHDHAGTEGCNACSAFCSATPLLSAMPSLAEPLDPAAVKFAELSAPPPSNVSDGQERPPRTI
jgi:ABC-type Zn2+ transport system substrate-binding protein/surface adhesin